MLISLHPIRSCWHQRQLTLTIDYPITTGLPSSYPLSSLLTLSFAFINRPKDNKCLGVFTCGGDLLKTSELIRQADGSRSLSGLLKFDVVDSASGLSFGGVLVFLANFLVLSSCSEVQVSASWRVFHANINNIGCYVVICTGKLKQRGRLQCFQIKETLKRPRQLAGGCCQLVSCWQCPEVMQE